MTDQEKKEMMEEINSNRKKFNDTKNSLKVKSNFPKINRTYTYRKSISLK